VAIEGVARHPLLLPEGYGELFPYFDLTVVEEAAQDFRIPRMTRAIFYDMVVNDAWELGVVSRELAEHLKLSLEGLRWYMCEAWLQLDKHALWLAQYGRYANPGGRP